MTKRKQKIDSTEAKLERFIKREWRIIVNSMMYNKRPSDRLERFLDQAEWWFKIIMIFFALKGITYTIWGR